MTTIERWMLRAKHWQIAPLLIGTSLAGQILVVAQLPAGSGVSPQELQAPLRSLTLVTLVSVLLMLVWFWSLGDFLSGLVPQSLRLPLRRFRLSLIYPSAYMAAVFMLETFIVEPQAMDVSVIIPFHLLAMFCMFYNLHFVARSLVLAETRQSASFSDYAGPFFLLWFFPIGVWFIQPRINRLYAQAQLARNTPTAPGD